MRRAFRALLVVAVVVIGGIDLLLWTDPGRRLLVRWFDDGYAFAGTNQPGPPSFEGEADRPRIAIDLQIIAAVGAQPTDAVFPTPTLAVVARKTGELVCVDLTHGAVTPWTTLEVVTSSELGLLGLALHPDWPSTPLLYVHRNVAGGRAAMSAVEARRVASPLAPCSGPLGDGTALLQLDQPYANHDGGQIRFGPDRMLWIGFGDGGFRGDPLNAGQDPATWLGKILRVDIGVPSAGRDVTDPPYRIPADNPFVADSRFKPEIAAWGLRNPWRFDFLPDGRLAIGDVGQNLLEELDFGRLGDNFGWRFREGDRCYDPESGCPTDGLVEPVFTYPRSLGTSITGGVYVPSAGPLAGHVVFGDFATGRLWATDAATHATSTLGKFKIHPSAFVTLPDGDVGVLDFTGTFWRLSPGVPGRP